MSINIKKLSRLKIFRGRDSLKGFAQLEKLINNNFALKVDKTNKKLFYLKNKKSSVFLTGFTLIELLVAIAIFSIGIMAAFSLSWHNLSTVKENANRVIAADLAREGIEIVRNVRDSNWLAREAGIDRDPSSPATIEFYEWDSALNFDNATADYTSGVLTQLGSTGESLDYAIDHYDQAILSLVNGFYTQVPNQPTAFRRAINLKAICLNPLVTPVTESVSISKDCAPGLSKVGLRITSRVKYTYGAKTNSIDAVGDIYNWR